MLEDEALPRVLRRLADELDDDGVELGGDPAFQRVVLEELDHCRRTPVFEGRRPTYGAMVTPDLASRKRRRALLDHVDFDIVPMDGDLLAARAYADGRSSYLVRDLAGQVALACFDRVMLFESDLVRVQQLTGAAIVQRTPVLDVVRILVDDSVINWDGRNWQVRPSAASLTDTLLAAAPELGEQLAADVLELAIHWLAPSRIGATIVLTHGPIDPSALDFSTAAHTPPLSMTNRRHFAALVAVLRMHDLAVVVDTDGALRKVAVGLRWSDAAEEAVDNDRGMRHRSAQRYSHDQHDATIVVVSEDGPVTIYRDGDVVLTTGTVADPMPPTLESTA
ncbi:MAG: DNA integrity scanning protein DisA nucleotide-binding domain protein [Actinomycetota bacterium]|nr:DNA integrity scanning protein DisA nucleotide-binding domain protein [Actinomycetota bacterium]